MSTPSAAVDSRFHTCECGCDHCRENLTGYFAQRAALDGNLEAAAHFAPGVYRFLAASAAQKITRRASRRRWCLGRPMTRLIFWLFGGGELLSTVWDLVQAIRAHGWPPIRVIAVDGLGLAVLVVAALRQRGRYGR